MKRLVILLAIVALAAGACGGGDEDAGIPSLETESPSAVATTSGRVDAEEALLDFSQCMRDEGIDLPDIGVAADGTPLLSPDLLDRFDIESDEFAVALDTCQPILARSEAFNIDVDPALRAQIEDQLVKFSQCMRDEGFEDFPDPSSLDGGQPYPLSVLAQFSDPAFEAAVEVCQRDLAFPGQDG